MSNFVWTPPKYLAWSVFKSPQLNTLVQPATSGKTTRSQLWANPKWNYKLTWELLKGADGPPSSLNQILDFFCARGGAFDTFLYSDPTDNAVVGQILGYGDGSRTTFQLLRSLNNQFYESIQNPNAVTNVYINGSPLAQFAYAIGRQNLLLQSQALASSPWTGDNNGASNPTPTNNAGVAPDGSNTATSIAYPSTLGGLFSTQVQVVSLLPISGQQYTFSVWLKAVSGPGVVTMIIQDNPFTAFTSSGGFVANLSGAWQKFSLTGIFGPSVQPQIYVGLRSGSQAAQTVLSWGAQLESGQLGGYVPTTTSQLVPNGLVVLAAAPTDGLPVTADFSFYQRLRFTKDINEFEEFMNNLWALKTLELVSERS